MPGDRFCDPALRGELILTIRDPAGAPVPALALDYRTDDQQEAAQYIEQHSDRGEFSYDMPSGPVTITLRAPGYVQLERQVFIVQGRPTPLTVVLQPAS